MKGWRKRDGSKGEKKRKKKYFRLPAKINSDWLLEEGEKKMAKSSSTTRQ